MALFRRDPPIVAVAHAVDNTRDSAKTLAAQSWQTEAWRYWHNLGEIHYPTSQIARLVSRVNWTTGEGEDDDEPNIDLETVFENPGLTEISRLVALNIEVSGEGWLILTEVDAQDRRIDARWEVVSPTAMKLTQRLDRSLIKVRFWNPDPEDQTLADSAVRAALGPASELWTMQSLSKSQAMNRIATAGILLRPASRKPMVDDNGEPVDFNDMLTEAMLTAIQDETSASAVVPIDLELPIEEIEHWKHLIFERPYDEHLAERMERAIRRIALALDIWPELLLGVADINHWNAWFLQEDTWQGHIAPIADQVAGTLEVAAREAQVEVGTITPDPTELLARRSPVRDALDVAKLGGVGLTYLREAIGATDEDAPTEEDLETIALMLGRSTPVEEEEEVAERPGAPETEEEAGEEPELPIAAAAGDISAGLGVELARIDDQLRSWLEGAADQVVGLARARVGMRVRTALRGDPRSRELDGVRNSEVAHYLGRDAVSELIDLEQTVSSTMEPLAERWVARLTAAEAQITRMVGDLGLNYEQARKASAEALIDDLTNFTIESITRTDAEMPLPELRRIIAIAGVQ